MSRQVLIILGSPRKKGNSATIAAQIGKGASENGATVEAVFLSGKDIKPCQGCGGCQKETASGCVIEDDMQLLYQKLKDADSVVVASPIYWFNFSAQTKMFLDRLYAVGVGDKNIFAGKGLALALAYADEDPFDSGAVNALRSFQDTCKFLGANVEGMVYGSAYAAGEIVSNQLVMEKAYSLGVRLAEAK